jgi:hypothetical protein
MGSSSKTRRANAAAQQAFAPRLPSDVRITRRCHSALHRFAEELRGELDEAVRNAKSRGLGAARRIVQIGNAVLAQGVAAVLEMPSGFSIGPDLALGLKYVDHSALAERIDAWSTIVVALARYEGKPFDRKSLVIGERKERRRAPPPDDGEQANIAALEREAQKFLKHFRDAVAKFERRLVAKRNKGERKVAGESKMLTAPQAAKRLAVAPEKVRRWIENGELAATNAALQDSSRPRWRIDPKDLEDFRTARKPARSRMVPQRRSKKKPDEKEYF